MKIWIDADACPNMIKEIIFRASNRLQMEVCLVANSVLITPKSALITSIQVEKGLDVADFYIVQHSAEEDLVITADIPLAALIVEKGATAINPRGEHYTKDNVGERLSVRDFMQDLRDTGIQTRGPAPLGPKDKVRFANSLDKILAQRKR